MKSKNILKRAWNVMKSDFREKYLDGSDEPGAYSNYKSIIFGFAVLCIVYLLVYSPELDFSELDFSLNRKEIGLVIHFAFLMAACIYVCVQLSKSLNLGKVFSIRNGNLISCLGYLFYYTSIVLVTILRDHLVLGIIMALFTTLAGWVLWMAGYMIRCGVRMQEEQELTV